MREKGRGEKLFEYLRNNAQSCPKCGKKLGLLAVKMGFGDEIIGEYCCENRECLGHRHGIRSYRRLLPSAVRFIKEKGILSEEEISFVEIRRSGAMAAEIRCGKCGYKRRYVESVFTEDGRLLHKFRCDNKDCVDFEKSISIELKEEDCAFIFKKEKEKAKCRICGETSGAKVHCQKHGGFICEKHCAGCEFLENRTSMTHCVWWIREGAAQAAKKGFEEYGKALREHREI